MNRYGIDGPFRKPSWLERLHRTLAWLVGGQ